MPLDTDGRWTGEVAFSIPNPTVVDGAGHSYVDSRGLFVLHAALLRTGKVICFSGHVEFALYAPLCYLFDPKNPTQQMKAIDFPVGGDLFCCHYVQTADGSLLAMGGSQHDLGFAHPTVQPVPPNNVTASNPSTQEYVYRGSTGSKTIAVFDPDNESWRLTGSAPSELIQGRWYPTPVALPDGRVAVFSGRREIDLTDPSKNKFSVWSYGHPAGTPASGVATMVEIFSPPDWSAAELAGASKELPIYPGLHLAPNGRIYFTHCTWGQELPNPDTAYLEIPDGATSVSGWTVYTGVKPPHPRREEGMSVLLPPAQDGKILVVGGSQALTAGGAPAVLNGADQSFHHIENPADPKAMDILDTTVNAPSNPWAQSPSAPPSLSFGRINGHCVLLPDATVLICGGHDNYKWRAKPQTTPSLDAEMYTPSASGGSVRTVAAMHAPRMYHSVALLLPDGRVFVAGGADRNKNEPPPTGATWNADPTTNYPAGWRARTGFPTALNARTYEFYEPPYMFKGARPKIDDVTRDNGVSTQRIQYGDAFKIKTQQAADIGDVALIRPGCPTHHTDTEQRFVRLAFTSGSGELTVTAVNDPKIAPPGYYMLWIVDTQKRPCEEAVFIRLLPRPGRPGGGTTCFIATAALGSADHPSVRYLQLLREDLRGGDAFGRLFIVSVTRVYETFSPRVAQRLRDDDALRDAVRTCVVRPTVAIIRASDAVSQKIPARGAGRAALVMLLLLEGLIGVAATPILIALVFGRTISLRRRVKPL